MAGLGSDRGNQRSVGFLLGDREKVILGRVESMVHGKVDQLLGDRIKVAMRRRVRALELGVDLIPSQDTTFLQRVRVQFQNLNGRQKQEKHNNDNNKEKKNTEGW